MARVESTIQVSKPVEKVFAFLNEAENHARFIPNMAKLTQTSGGAFGQIGATARGLLRYLGFINIPVQYQISEVDPNRSLAMNGKMGPILFKDGYILSPGENGSRIKFWLELNPTGWGAIFRPFAGLIGKIHAQETLRNLKREIHNSVVE